jgi:hypothetical protein
MTSFFSQASPPPYTSALSTPPSPSIKRRRDQTHFFGGKVFFDSSLASFTNKIVPERNYKVRKHWVPKAKRNQEQETEYNGESQHLTVSQEPVRRSARVRNKVSYNVDDEMEK